MNIAVDIAGFIMIAKKMDGLKAEVEKLATSVEQLKDITIENIRSECEKLSLDYNSFATKIHDEDPIERDKLEEFLTFQSTHFMHLY